MTGQILTHQLLSSTGVHSRRRSARAALGATASRLLPPWLRARSPLQPLARWWFRNHLTVLGYHQIDAPDTFAKHLDHLVARATPVSLDEAIDALLARAELPPHAVLVTFDDGHPSLLDTGLPLLRQRGVPAVAFVVAGSIDTHRPHWWTEVRHLVAAGGVSGRLGQAADTEAVELLKRVTDEERQATIRELRASAREPAPPARQLRHDELRELEAGGVEVASHSLTHPCLDRCTNDVIHCEVRRAHELLTGVLGHEPRAFAYPNGDHDARVRRAVAACGYQVAFAFDGRLSPLPAPDRLAVSRVHVESGTSLDRFRVIVSGLQAALFQLRSRVAHNAGA